MWEGGRERPRLSTSGFSHCFGLLVVEFKFVHYHLGFDVIKTLLHGEEEIRHLMRGRRDPAFDEGPQIPEAESHRGMSDERLRFNNSGK